jgi:hypothetical protein
VGAGFGPRGGAGARAGGARRSSVGHAVDAPHGQLSINALKAVFGGLLVKRHSGGGASNNNTEPAARHAPRPALARVFAQLEPPPPPQAAAGVQASPREMQLHRSGGRAGSSSPARLRQPQALALDSGHTPRQHD